MTRLTSKQYRECGGNKCPACGSENITGGSVEIDGSGAWQRVDCDDCEATWTDNYTLDGYNDLETKND